MIHVTDIIPAVGTVPDDWSGYSWLAVWDEMVPLPCDLEMGGEVILVDPSGLATWRTEVTDLIMFPFEHVQGALEELTRRWGIEPIYNGPIIAPGVLVAWRARPIGYIGSTVPDVSAMPSLVCSNCADDELRHWLRQLPPLVAANADPS